jgi:hypothetical protein
VRRFNLTGRGPVVIGRIVDGEIHKGDRFRVIEPPAQGTVRGLTLVRTSDRGAVGLLVDVVVAPGAEMVAIARDV